MRRIINPLRNFYTMLKHSPFENKEHVLNFLKEQNIDYKTYDHAPAKTVQDIIGTLFIYLVIYFNQI